MNIRKEKKICDEIIGIINLGYDNIRIPNDEVRDLLRLILIQYSQNLEESIAHIDYWNEVCRGQDIIERC